jgi:pseudaminic acid synthase
MGKNFSIDGRVIGAGNPVYIVAEMSANHQGDFNTALRILEEAKKAGADALKLQTYTADTLTLDCDNEYFRIRGTLWNGRKLHELYREAYTPWEWQPKLKEAADAMNLTLFSTPFDETAVDFLQSFDIPAYKVASFELVDLGLLRKIAETGKPVIMSTGMADLAEIHEAVDTPRKAACEQIALLKCTSAYPASPESINLLTIPHLASTFDLPVGLSDHTMGVEVPVAAVAIGACIVEKHFTLSRSAVGPDSAFSLEPQEFKAMVDTIRTTERALGDVRYGATEEETGSKIFRRSLFIVEDLKAGQVLTAKTVRSIRPGHGLHPRHLDEVLGRRVNTDVPRGTPLSWALLEDSSLR